MIFEKVSDFKRWVGAYKISDHELIEIRIKNVNNPKVIRNGTKIFKYRKNIFQREINNILGNEERQDLNYMRLWKKQIENFRYIEQYTRKVYRISGSTGSWKL